MEYGLPGSRSRPSAASATRLIHAALDHGINHFDTARAYGDSEAFLGAALQGRRGSVILTTKVSAEPLVAMTASVGRSLSLLRTDYVDVLMIHSAPLEVLYDDFVIGNLLRLKEQGRFRFLGASVYGNAAAEAAIDRGCFDCLQVAYNALDRRLESGVFARAQAAGVGLVARSVLLKGALTSRYLGLPATYADLRAAVQRLELLGLPLPELAYRYVLPEPAVATALVGTQHVTELEEVLDYAKLGALPAAIVDAIRREAPLGERWLNPGLWP